MQKKNCVLCISIGIIVCILLSACSRQPDFDAKSYVQSSLDAHYHGEYKDYANLLEISEKDAKKECAHYEEVIKSLGGVDLQLLGLGHNGHIGFNEPADVFDPSAWQAKSRSIAGDSVSDQSISDISLRVYKSYTG